jgi:dolichyl-phosphate beta-glucosyltransferase
MSDSPCLSIVIPAFNEQKRITGTLENIVRFIEGCDFLCEMIIVDDGSVDGTKKVIEPFCSKYPFIQLICFPENRGKGHAVRAGIEACGGRYILFSDADLSTPISEVLKMLKLLEKGCDIVIGSRALKDSIILVRQPWWRQGMGKIFNFLIRLFILKGIKDTQCGFKCFRSEVAKKLFSMSTLRGFAFDVEILLLASQMNYKIVEVPIVWRNDASSKVHPFFDSWRMMVDLVKLKGRYGVNETNRSVKDNP